jgi:hypothetical protein
MDASFLKRVSVFLYTLTIFISAALLFLVQPLFARLLLPALGGSPAVWNTALVFYQAALLAGYGWAHLSITKLGARRQALIHLVILALPILLLPIGVPSPLSPPTSSSPVFWLLGLMTVTVGAPFFAVSTTSPTLQRWFAASGHPHSHDPYFLYAASNAGSMLALFGYPLFYERYFRLNEQSWWWAVGYGLFWVMMALCAAWLWRNSPKGVPSTQNGIDAEKMSALASEDSTVPTEKITAATRWRWILLSLAPSSLMVSVTTYLSTDIAAIPLLWVIPLALYLLTFIFVFASRPLIPHVLCVRAVPLIILPLVVSMAGRATQPMSLLIPLHLLALFFIAMACHGELAADRPHPKHLTEFFLLMSVGGVLGGAFNGLLAPVIFKSIMEYPITLVLASLLVLRPDTPSSPIPDSSAHIERPALARRVQPIDITIPVGIGLLTAGLVLGLQAAGLTSGAMALGPMFGLPAVLLFPFSRRPWAFGLGIGAILAAATLYGGGQIGRVLYADRSFFGVHRVTLSPAGNAHQILHGNTIHGIQSILPGKTREPQSYYHRTGPIGQLFQVLNSPLHPLHRPRRVAVVGLGAGGMACYARRQDNWTFYEIDPVVVHIAEDPKFFTYLRDCPAPRQNILGDGRLMLAKAPDAAYDVLMLDAYSSDSLPVHLLTREAMALYVRKLAPGGILIFNVSNRSLDLESTLGNLAHDAGLFGLAQVDEFITKEQQNEGKTASHFAVLARNRDTLGALATSQRWQPIKTNSAEPVWNDNYSSVLSVFRWD